MEIKAQYLGGEITSITGNSLVNEKLEVQFESAGGISHARAKAGDARCFILVKRTLPDGSVITSSKQIPCGNLPKPKKANTN